MAQLAHHPVLQPIGELDDAVYVQLARRVASGDLLLAPDAFFLAPFYTYFLGAVFAATDGLLLAARSAQILLGTAAVLLVLDTARQWFGRRTGLVSGALAAGTGLFAFNEVLISQSSIDPFLTALSSFALTRAVRGGSIRTFLLAGLASAALVLNRPNALACALAAGLVWLATQRSKAAGRQALAFALGLALLIAPVTLRNRVVTGEWVLVTSHGGLNLVIGNGPGADGLWRRIPGVRDNVNGQVEDVRRIAGAALGHPASAGEASAYFSGLAWRWMRSQPWDALRLFFRKLALTVSATDAPLNYSYAYFAHDEATLLRWLVVGPWLLVPLGLFGLVVAAPVGGARGAFAAWASFVPSYAVGLAAFFVASRYRLPLFVGLLPGAGAAVVWLARALAATRFWPLSVGAAVLSVLFLLVNWPLNVDDGRLVEREGHIVRLFGDGHVEEGQRLLAATESREPRFGRLLCRAGLALRDRNDYSGAIRYMERAAKVDPADRWIRFHLGETLLALDRVEEALSQLALARGAPGIPAAEITADVAGAHQLLGHADLARAEIAAAPPVEELSEYDLRHLGEVALQVRAPDVAERFLRALTARTRTDAKAHELLGVALGLRNLRAEAVVELETAVRLDPDERLGAGVSRGLPRAGGAGRGGTRAARRGVETPPGRSRRP